MLNKIISQISSLRDELLAKVEQRSNGLQDEEVQKLSKRLDKLILKYYCQEE
ncbi:aspartyl-phosphate phosphatase Spo0E family protein [Orenia marismortui]|uniref:aspartyl-phosphate phosphatase Spo0E family protein n=1 Tax=Orenia marismortui TaxID=46469 RepID=UPI00036FDD48|nr:aspartyl-phosphate phosphatase Spo0E family protein [Orenia marismortui]